MAEYQGHDRRTSPTREQVQDMIRAAVAEGFSEGMKTTFATLGLDVYDPDDLSEWHADRKFLRDMREASEHGRTASIAAQANLRTGIISGVVGAAVAGAIAWFTQGHKP